jgi:ribonuclease Z
MEITVLGTGHGSATECYNTCFAMKDNDEYFLIDSGGGNEILKQLKRANIELEKIRYIFISHTHMDHILGCIWVIRVLSKKYYKGTYSKPIYIYGNDIVIKTIRELCQLLIPKDFLSLLDDKIKLIEVKEGEEINIFKKKVKFFDINAKKAKQFGFSMSLDNGKVFTFIGDEVCSNLTEKYVKDSCWLFADAYMAGEEAEKYNPIEKHYHSTVKYVAQLCEGLNVENVILSHTMDNDLKNRKETFMEDAQKYYSGKVFVPDDLEKINIL